MVRLLIILFFFVLFIKAEEKVKYIDNGQIKLGIDLVKGGSITYLADSNIEKNLINNFDLGRQIQMAFYSGPIPFLAKGQTPADHWKHIGWNPIQTGDDFDNHSDILESKITESSIYLKCTPVQWPLNNVKGDCFFESWIRLEGNVVHYKGKITNFRKDKKQYPARHQELPAVYLNSEYFKLVTYKGDKPFTGDSLFINSQPLKPKQHWHYWTASENWAAYVNDKDYGLGVYKPRTFLFSGGFAGVPNSGGTKANSTAYIAPISSEIIDHNISYEYETYFILGSVRKIRDFVYKNKAKEFNHWTFDNNRESWTTVGLSDKGWPVKGFLSARFQGKPGAYFISPLTFADLSEKNRLLINLKHTGKTNIFNIAFKMKGKISQPFPVRIKEKDKICAYEITVSEIKDLSGIIENILIYPFSGQSGEDDSIEIHSVKLQ